MTYENPQTNPHERQNSYVFRYGGTATDIKIYFSTAEDLRNQLLALSQEATEINMLTENVKTKLGGY